MITNCTPAQADAFVDQYGVWTMGWQMAKRWKPLGTTRLGMTPTPDGVGLLVSRVVIVAVPRLGVLCFEVSLNVNADRKSAVWLGGARYAYRCGDAWLR